MLFLQPGKAYRKIGGIIYDIHMSFLQPGKAYRKIGEIIYEIHDSFCLVLIPRPLNFERGVPHLTQINRLNDSAKDFMS